MTNRNITGTISKDSYIGADTVTYNLSDYIEINFGTPTFTSLSNSLNTFSWPTTWQRKRPIYFNIPASCSLTFKSYASTLAPKDRTAANIRLSAVSNVPLTGSKDTYDMSIVKNPVQYIAVSPT